MRDLPILILGAGGHGRVVASALSLAGRKILGFLDADRDLWGTHIGQLPVIGGDDRLQNFSPDAVRLVNGIGSTGAPDLRKAIFEKLRNQGFLFETVVHPSACIATGVILDEGVQIMAGVVIQVGARIGCNVIVNTGAIVDHDCVVDAHSHVASGAALSGGVNVGSCCHIGTGSVMIQSVSLGEESLVAAGAVVTRSFPAHSFLVGVPARMAKTI